MKKIFTILLVGLLLIVDAKVTVNAIDEIKVQQTTKGTFENSDLGVMLLKAHPTGRRLLEEKEAYEKAVESFEKESDILLKDLANADSKTFDVKRIEEFLNSSKVPLYTIDFKFVAKFLEVTKTVEKKRVEIKAVQEAELKRIAEEKRLEEERIAKEAALKAQEAARKAAQQTNQSKPQSTSSKPQSSSPAKYGANQLCISGICKTFTDTGIVRNTSKLQTYIDRNLIPTSGTTFNPHDNQTTYFSGHNYSHPGGPMHYMHKNIYDGAIITVTDKNGTPYRYKVRNHVYSYHSSGNVGSFGPNGISAINLYSYGSGEESIAIQFCRDGGRINTIWYATPLF